MSGAFEAWIGRQEQAADRITASQARQLAATLEVEGRFAPGDPLPPLWHWLGWTPDAPMSGLGPDGHPTRGGFLPPVPLERRMWAGGRLTFLAPLCIDEPLQRGSTILKVTEKAGTTGRMVFVTVGHEVHGGAGLAIREEQDIVYVAMPDRYAPPPPVLADPPDWQVAVGVDTVRLFRFSAVTFNAHRIHYDLPYATGVEKYPGLVVHGPLQAMLLMQAAVARGAAVGPASYRFRGVRPAFHTDRLTLQGTGDRLCTVTAEGFVCMQADIGWTS